MTEINPIKGGARSSARLAAVQALYQIEASDAKSAREQGCEDFHMDESGGYELDVVGCDLIE